MSRANSACTLHVPLSPANEATFGRLWRELVPACGLPPTPLGDLLVLFTRLDHEWGTNGGNSWRNMVMNGAPHPVIFKETLAALGPDVPEKIQAFVALCDLEPDWDGGDWTDFLYWTAADLAPVFATLVEYCARRLPIEMERIKRIRGWDAMLAKAQILFDEASAIRQQVQDEKDLDEEIARLEAQKAEVDAELSAKKSRRL